jgi:hypothetical protein
MNRHQRHYRRNRVYTARLNRERDADIIKAMDALIARHGTVKNALIALIEEKRND